VPPAGFFTTTYTTTTREHDLNCAPGDAQLYVAARMDGRNLLTLIENGGVVMYPLLLCSVVSVAVILERLWTIVRAARAAARLHEQVCEATDDGNATDALAIARRDRSPLGAVYKAVLSNLDGDEDLRGRIAIRRHAETARRLKRYVWLLGTVGSLAPFIGLLGTVLGIIRAFENMAASGSGGFAVVAAGISEALIATAGGLLVGVLSIFAYNAFMVRIGNLSAVWREWTDELLVAIARPRPREGTISRVAQSR
jgi:biopolymer transport protein ExbB